MIHYVSFAMRNFHYVYKLVEMLCGDTSLLPMLETRKAGIAVGTAIGVAALAGIYSWFSSKDDDKKDEDKKEQKKIKGPEAIEQNES